MEFKYVRPHISLGALHERQDGNAFQVDSQSLTEILKNHKTPLYVTSLKAVAERVQAYQASLQAQAPQFDIFYAMKANFAQAVLKTVQGCGAGVDIVSIGEWRAARRAHFQPQKICFAGVGKRPEEWMETIAHGIGFLNVEHVLELEEVLNFIAQQKPYLNSIPCVALRLNPCLEIDTHPHLKTGALDSKFGVLFEHFQTWLRVQKQKFVSPEAFQEWAKPLSGLHVHLGSQLLSQDVFVHTVRKVLDCAQFMFEMGVMVKHLDLGGGLGVPLTGVAHNNKDIQNHVELLFGSLKRELKSYPHLLEIWKPDLSGLHVSLEPGRSVVASSTVFLTTVLYTKTNSEDIRFCYVDGGMNDFPRPSIYGAQHHAELVLWNEATAQNIVQKNWQVVGPVCESGDFLSKQTQLPDSISRGCVLAFFEAGAYCRSMASEYNLRPLPEEIFL